MDATLAVRVEPLLVPGFAAVASLWFGFSGWVVADRVRYDRRSRRLASIQRALADPTLAALRPLQRDAAVRDMLSHLPTLDVYRMTGDVDLPPWVREQCGAHALEHVGLQRMLRDAMAHRGARRKWRRVSALNALVYARPASIHGLLREALADADVDVASAAASVLQRLGDRRAAEILIGGLRASRLPASRIAARLERFSIALEDLLQPLLTSTRPEARYWAVTLLRKYHDLGGLVESIVPLVDDADASVRKAALLTLGAMQSPDIVRLASWRLTDPAPFVRSAALHALAQAGERTPDRGRRSALASTIAPALADRDWSVRTAAKDALAAARTRDLARGRRAAPVGRPLRAQRRRGGAAEPGCARLDAARHRQRRPPVGRSGGRAEARAARGRDADGRRGDAAHQGRADSRRR